MGTGAVRDYTVFVGFEKWIRSEGCQHTNYTKSDVGFAGNLPYVFIEC